MIQKISLVIGLFILLGCNSESSSEPSIKKDNTPFPKKYLNLYAGMTVDELMQKLKAQNFVIEKRIQNFTENNGEPRIEATNGKIQITAWEFNGQVSSIKFISENNPEFFDDLLEIYNSFNGEEHAVEYGESYFLDNLETYVRPNDYILFLYDHNLIDSLSAEEEKYNKMTIRNNQKKYE